ncbi:MAG: hypothetical protein ACTHKY_20775 [Ginsengibacter sp.]
MANDGGHKTRGGSKRFYEIYGTKNKAGFNKESSCCIVAFKISEKDREYLQIAFGWERNALTIELKSLEMFKQKLEYIHCNLVVAGLCGLPEEYRYSTARFYETRINNWDFITHYTE